MSKRIFSKGEIAELLKYRQVIRCTPRAITNRTDFKITAVRQYREEGIPAKDIFRKAGFDLEVIGRDNAKFRVRDWLRIFKTKSREGLRIDARGGGGGRPKTKGSDADKIKWLEAKVAYLKAENAFLAKLRAARAE
jgi:transposase